MHGTFAGSFVVSWQSLSPMLAHDGYCVFALDYGQRGTKPIEQSAAQLRDFVDRVLTATAAVKVSIVGHSQGGMMPRYYSRNLDEVEPGVDYTVISTRYDEVVTPYRSQYLTGPAEQVTNITLQTKCPLDLTEHLVMIYDYPALQWVQHALLRDGPASPSFRTWCL